MNDAHQHYTVHVEDIALAIEDIVRATNNLAVETGAHINPPAWVLHLTVMFPRHADEIRRMAWDAYEAVEGPRAQTFCLVCAATGTETIGAVTTGDGMMCHAHAIAWRSEKEASEAL